MKCEMEHWPISNNLHIEWPNPVRAASSQRTHTFSFLHPPSDPPHSFLPWGTRQFFSRKLTCPEKHPYIFTIHYLQASPTYSLNLQLRSPRIRYLRKASHMKKWSQTKPIKKELRDNSKMKILWQSRHYNGPERDLICPVVVVFSWKKSCKYLCF